MVSENLPTATPVAQYAPDCLLDTGKTAALLDAAPKTLIHWRCTGSGDLPYIKVGRLVRYRYSDVMAWLEKQTRNTGAEISA